ncbi:MAG: SGNH/GDSL hydrolase family protein [Leptospirales bacterium]|nr:SGNH/GDSL hydrolase family protein [Leptospirales bacterium]
MNELSTGRKVAFTSIPIVLLLLISWGILSLIDRERVLVRGDDPEMVYSFYENREGVAASDEYRSSVRINAKGLRSPNLDFKDSSPRAIFFGDSFAEGWGVELDESFPIKSGALAGVSVDNAGIHGGGPWYYILRGRKFLADATYQHIVIQIFDNDVKDQDEFLPVIEVSNNRLVRAKPPGMLFIPSGGFTRFLRDSAPFRIIKRLVFALRGNRLPIKYYKPGREPKDPLLDHAGALTKFGPIKPLADPDKDFGGQFGFYRFKSLAELKRDPVWSRRADGFHNAMQQMIEEFRAAQPKARLTVVYLPARQIFAPGGAVVGGADGIVSNPLFELLQESLANHNVTLVDLRQDLGTNPNDFYFPGDGHLNARGHQVVAQHLARVLK